MCVDLRAVNAICEATAWPMPMPFLESIVRNLAGSKYWFLLDALRDLDNALAKESQEIFFYDRSWRVYTDSIYSESVVFSNTVSSSNE
jgi:deoxyribodipyrimidine photolyase